MAPLTARQFRSLEAIVREGLASASAGLSAMSGGQLRLESPVMRMIPLTEVPEVAGGPAAVVVAVYLAIGGDLRGHLVLLFTEAGARRAADFLFGAPPGTTAELGPLELSALAEAGNVAGSHLLNVLANRTGLAIVPSAPAVVTDMAGAILQQVVLDLLLQADEVLLVETAINGTVQGYFLLLPDQDSMSRLVAALEDLA